jgi:DNA-binding transcriptional regulator YhcF (GntR family)
MHTLQPNVLGELRIEPTGVPIYVQLRDQLLAAIGAGVLAPGAQMPTMREVAVALRVDLNTVRHAYDELERAGAISLERGRGSFVSASPPLQAPAALRARTDGLARQVLAAAAAQRIDPLDLAARIVALAATKEGTP